MGTSQAPAKISPQYLYKVGAGDEQQNDIFFEIVLPTGHDAASSISSRLCCAVKSLSERVGPKPSARCSTKRDGGKAVFLA